MARPLVMVLDDYQGVALSSADWSPLAGRADVQVITGHVADPAELAALLAPATVIVAMRERTPLSAALLDHLPRLEFVVTTGMRNAALDMDALRRRGIPVSGTASVASATPELTWALLQALTRHVPAEDAAVRAGGWQHTVGTDLAGRTLGLLGLGRVGSVVARYAAAFDMQVLAWSQNLTAERAAECGARRVEKDQLFAESDIVSVHVKLSERTRGLVGATELAALGPEGYLVNTSRGPIVAEAALLAALNSGGIAGAALDVFDVEPLPADHPLRTAPRTVLTPHIGYGTQATYRTFFQGVVEDLVAWLDGSPVRLLD